MAGEIAFQIAFWPGTRLQRHLSLNLYARCSGILANVRKLSPERRVLADRPARATRSRQFCHRAPKPKRRGETRRPDCRPCPRDVPDVITFEQPMLRRHSIANWIGLSLHLQATAAEHLAVARVVCAKACRHLLRGRAIGFARTGVGEFFGEISFARSPRAFRRAGARQSRAEFLSVLTPLAKW